MNKEEMLKAIEAEIKSIFKEQTKEIEVSLRHWAEKILDLKISILAGHDVETKKRTEKYAWAAMMCIMARQANKVEKNLWRILEMTLRLIRNVFLS